MLVHREAYLPSSVVIPVLAPVKRIEGAASVVVKAVRAPASAGGACAASSPLLRGADIAAAPGRGDTTICRERSSVGLRAIRVAVVAVGADALAGGPAR